MRPLVLGIWLLTSTIVTDALMKEPSKELEVVKYDQGGVDERAGRLLARLEALKEVEEVLQVVKEESRGGSRGADFVQVESTSTGKKNRDGAAELLARLKTIKEQSRSFNPEENVASYSSKQSGKRQSSAKGLLARCLQSRSKDEGLVIKKLKWTTLDLS